MAEYFISPSGRYIGVLEPDLMTRDPRTIADATEDMIRAYDADDVWSAGIFERTDFVPCAYFGSDWQLINALMGEAIDLDSEHYGYISARDVLLDQLAWLDRRN